MIGLILLSVYLWVLVAASCAFFGTHCGSPYTTRQLFFRGLAVPIVMPGYILVGLFQWK